MQREQSGWVNGAGGSAAADVENEWDGKQWLRRDGQVVVISLVDSLLNSLYSVNILFRRCYKDLRELCKNALCSIKCYCFAFLVWRAK